MKKQTVFFGVALYDGDVAGTVLDSLWKSEADANRRVNALEEEIREDGGEQGGVNVVEIDISKAK
jgi:hypothetical protein